MDRETVVIANRQSHAPRIGDLQDELYGAAGVLEEVIAVAEYEMCRRALAEEGQRLVFVQGEVDDALQPKIEEASVKGEKVWDGEDLAPGIDYFDRWLVSVNQEWPPEKSIKFSIICYENFKQVFENYHVRAVVIWGQFAYPPHNMRALCEKYGVPFVHMEQGLLPNTLVIDPEGVSSRSSMTDKRWREFYLKGLPVSDYNRAKTALDNLQKGGESIIKSGEESSIRDIYETVGLDPTKPTILVPAQFDSDSNVLLFSDNFPQNLDVLKALLPIAKEHNIIFKQHPAMNERQRGALGSRVKHAFPEMFVIDDIKMSSLFQICDCIVTRTSGTGLEGLIQRMPVVTLGQSLFSNRGLTIDPKTPADVPGAVKQALSKGFWTANREWRRILFFWWLLTEHLFVSKNNEPAAGLHEQSVRRFKELLRL